MGDIQMESMWLHFIWDREFLNFILSPLHPSGKSYLVKSEVYEPLELVDNNYLRSAHQLNWSALIISARITS
jgi:hypothetical protein